MDLKELFPRHIFAPSARTGPLMSARLCRATGLRPVLGLNLDIHTGRQIQLGQGIHRPRRRRIDVQQPLVRMQLELLTSLLIDVRRTKYRENLLTRRQRNRTRNHRAGTTDGFNDLFGGFIHQIVIVRLQFDSDSLRHKPIPIFRWGCKGMYLISYYPKNQGFFFTFPPFPPFPPTLPAIPRRTHHPRRRSRPCHPRRPLTRACGLLLPHWTASKACRPS
jgi:hypothetical protein